MTLSDSSALPRLTKHLFITGFEPEADLNLVVSLLMFLQSSEVSHISSQVTDVLDFMNGNVGGPDVA